MVKQKPVYNKHRKVCLCALPVKQVPGASAP